MPTRFMVSDAQKLRTKAREGYSAVGYADTGGKPTIGWGHTGPHVFVGQRITKLVGELLFENDCTMVVGGLSAIVAAPLAQGQVDALFDFAFNLGVGALHTSALLRLVNAGDFAGAAAEFPKWVHGHKADGTAYVLSALVARRAEELSLFTGGTLPTNPNPATP